MGTLIDRVHRELTEADHTKIVNTYHAWRGDQRDAGPDAPTAKYEDVAGFCKSAPTKEIATHGYVLTPGRYVGAEEVEDNGDPFEEKMPRLVAELHAWFAESAGLEKSIRNNLRNLGFRMPSKNDTETTPTRDISRTAAPKEYSDPNGRMPSHES